MVKIPVAKRTKRDSRGINASDSERWFVESQMFENRDKFKNIMYASIRTTAADFAKPDSNLPKKFNINNTRGSVQKWANKWLLDTDKRHNRHFKLGISFSLLVEVKRNRRGLSTSYAGTRVVSYLYNFRKQNANVQCQNWVIWWSLDRHL